MRRLLFSFIILLVFSPLLSTKPVCNYCDKEIGGVFVHVQDFYYHPSHFKCSVCKSQITGSKYYYENNKFYDDSCYVNISRVLCNYCKKDITGKYLYKDDKKFHEKCYQQYYDLVCDHCKRSITGEYFTLENAKYHKACYENSIAYKCALCYRSLTEEFYIDLYDKKYCPSHEKDAYHCEYCGGFFTLTHEKNGKILSDNRACCSICLETAVFKYDENHEIFTDINERFKKYDLDIDLDEVEFVFVDKEKLHAVMDNASDKVMGFTSYNFSKTMFGLMTSEEIKIYVLAGLPRPWLIKTLAHEYNHVWQFVRSAKEKDSDFCEGSCNFAAYLILDEYTDPVMGQVKEQMFEEDDVDYGIGFRRVFQLVKEKGLDYWRDYLSQNKTFPAGY